jgi:hypothetical protein
MTSGRNYVHYRNAENISCIKISRQYRLTFPQKWQVRALGSADYETSSKWGYLEYGEDTTNCLLIAFCLNFIVGW